MDDNNYSVNFKISPTDLMLIKYGIEINKKATNEETSPRGIILLAEKINTSEYKVKKSSFGKERHLIKDISDTIIEKLLRDSVEPQDDDLNLDEIEFSINSYLMRFYTYALERLSKNESSFFNTHTRSTDHTKITPLYKSKYSGVINEIKSVLASDRNDININDLGIIIISEQTELAKTKRRVAVFGNEDDVINIMSASIVDILKSIAKPNTDARIAVLNHFMAFLTESASDKMISFIDSLSDKDD